MIQILNYSGENKNFEGKNIEINSIHDAKSLDDFEINIIDLNDTKIWQYKGSMPGEINIIADIISLSAMISNSSRAKIIILFPQNVIYQYEYMRVRQNDRLVEKYTKKMELKDAIPLLIQKKAGELCYELKTAKILYENTESKIGNMNAKAAFYFNDENGISLIRSTSGKKVVCKYGEIIASTLYFENCDQIIQFLKKIGLVSEKQEIPKWMEEIQMFDDVEQIDLIRRNREKIQEANQEIDKAKEIMSQNNRYKSILYTSGDELVDVVLEILGQILNYDFSQFEDKKNEDFLAEIGDDVFIGEIKGVNHNVKSENISQLDVHYQGYLENHNEEMENVHALLIMNHQKNKPIVDREPVHERQINLAKRNGSLIMETYILLKLFEKFKRNEISQEECICILKQNTGILTEV